MTRWVIDGCLEIDSTRWRDRKERNGVCDYYEALIIRPEQSACMRKYVSSHERGYDVHDPEENREGGADIVGSSG